MLSCWFNFSCATQRWPPSAIVLLRLSEKHQPGLQDWVHNLQTAGRAITHFFHQPFPGWSAPVPCVQFEQEVWVCIYLYVCVSQRNSGPLALPSYTHSHHGWLPGNCTCCFYWAGGTRAASTDWESVPFFKQLQWKLLLARSSVSLHCILQSWVTQL